MKGSQVVRTLKEDALGKVQLIETDGERGVLRVACGGPVPGSRLIARLLLRRERAALAALEGMVEVPRLMAQAGVGQSAGTLLRSFLPGAPLQEAEALPADFFDRLADLVRDCHARGVCHNDLHKEPNILVAPDGRPCLLDFQLASVHVRLGRSFRVRCREDLRHVEKHRRRYEDRGRKAEGQGEALPRRSWLAWTWLRFGKPVYNFVTRRILRTRDGEARRPSSGPWPRWDPPLGPRSDR